MKTIRRHVSLLAVFATFVGIGFMALALSAVSGVTVYQLKLTVVSTPLPEISATAALVVDRASGLILYEKQTDDVLPIASVTKLFSSALYYAGTDPFATTTILEQDVLSDGRSGRLKAEQTYQNRELLFPALLESSNDASSVMERAAPFNLLAAMNEYAKEHGATRTAFTDASGLSDQNVSTARELLVLFEAVLSEHSHIIDVTMLPQYFNHVNAWLNNNPFIEDPRYVGGKHGFTVAANRTALARFKEPVEDTEREVVYVVLGSSDLRTDILILREFVGISVSLE
jgi:D-alanyl-D-alanine endopeptidase (penicillin-binding protein 7)